MTLAEAKERLRIPELWRILNVLGECSKNPCQCPWREDRRASFSVSTDGKLWNDFATGQGGDAIDFLREATGLSPDAACRKFIELAGGAQLPLPPIKRTPVATQEARRPLPMLPAWHTGTPAEHKAIARLRHVCVEAVRCAAVSAEILRFGLWHGEPAWFITDRTGRNAQARRMDGKPWAHLEGVKAQTLPGCFASWPIGAEFAKWHDCLLLVEGGPDIIAGIHFALQGNCDCWPIGMLGAGQRIHEEALPLFAGKRVRIYPDADKPGREAAERWHSQLASVGAKVDAFDFAGLRKADGSPVKDLNDCTQIHPDDANELNGLVPNE